MVNSPVKESTRKPAEGADFLAPCRKPHWRGCATHAIDLSNYPLAPPGRTPHPGARTMAALIALGLCFGLFALFNLIEFKRLD